MMDTADLPLLYNRGEVLCSLSQTIIIGIIFRFFPVDLWLWAKGSGLPRI